jgi:hypothetical protein
MARLAGQSHYKLPAITIRYYVAQGAMNSYDPDCETTLKPLIYIN